MEPSVLRHRILVPYVPLRATMQRKRACVDLYILYNGRFEKVSFAITYILHKEKGAFLLYVGLKDRQVDAWCLPD